MSRFPLSPLLLLTALLAAGCPAHPPAPSAPTAAEAPDSPGATETPSVPPAAAAAARERPGVVVAVVVDQLGSWQLDRYWDHLPADGALRRAATRGALHRRVVLPYAGTYTAPGHVAIFTGAAARDSAVATNTIYSAARARRLAIIDDGRHPVLGVPGSHASPSVLRVDTVADRLREATGGAARVVSVSFKDRAAVLTAGRRPDIALWYEIAIPGFTTSAYYAAELPAWLVAWQQAHPTAGLLTPWTPSRPDLLAGACGADDAPGEGRYHGLDRAFPHDAAASSDPYRVVRLFPQATDYTFELALAAARHYQLGADDIPDLLIVSISSLDYTGHVFGAESCEYFDSLLRFDRALERFLAALAPEDRVAVLVTSDHGVSPLPERSRAAGKPATRILLDQLVATLDAAAPRPGTVIQFAQPFLHLSDTVRRDPRRRAAAVEAVVARLAAMPGIAGAYDVVEARAWHDDPDPVKRAVALSIPPADATDGDIFVLPARGAVFDEDMSRGEGTTHGTPWEYDTDVPVLLWGAGVSAAASVEPLAHDRVAATLAAMLGVPPPAHARGAPLPGAPAPVSAP